MKGGQVLINVEPSVSVSLLFIFVLFLGTLGVALFDYPLKNMQFKKRAKKCRNFPFIGLRSFFACEVKKFNDSRVKR